MNTSSYSNIVDKQEISALKEIIFQRARERAEAMTESTNVSYTDDVKNDVMEIAHNSFVASKNPFSEIINKPVTDETNTKTTEEIGFKQTSSPDLIAEITNKSQQIKSELQLYTIKNNMQDLKNNYIQKASFTGALDFLNAQGALSLMKNNDKNFEVIA